MNYEKTRLLYLSDAERYQSLESKEERTMLWLSLLRLIFFVGGLLLIWFGFMLNPAAGLSLIFVVIIVFLFLLKKYSDHQQQKEFLHNLVMINRNEAAALSGDLSSFEAGKEYSSTDHDFSNDIDVFGDSSLFQYLNRTVTTYGRDILAGWLSDPFSFSSEIYSRQEVVRELSAKEKWRQEFMAIGLTKPLEISHISELNRWLNEKDFVASGRIMKVLIYLLPAFTIASLLLLISGLIAYSVFIFFFLVNLFFLSIYLRKINKIHAVLSKKQNYLSSISRLISIFQDEKFESKILKEIRNNLSGSNISAAVSISRLNRLIQIFDSRMNILVSFVLNGLFLWDFHTVKKLEKWKVVYGCYLPGWLKMVGEVDAYISLGNFAFNNRGFTFPLISKSKVIFSGSQIGHPLIDQNKRVNNDFSIGGEGVIVVITGANMAGKSTFLRTVSVNYILAMTGAPVCASEMEFKPMKLFTSMRTTDSLSQNESYFYAELKRLKLLKSRIESGEEMLFILDEILKGTNSVDKSNGSKLFLKRLTALGATGLIATHDISLGEMENEFPDSVVNMCFEIDINGESIGFDYKVRPGITHKMNASILMNQMGILD